MRSSASGLTKEKETAETKVLEQSLRDLDQRLAELREQVRVLQEKAVKVTTERPMLALGVALVVGVAFGMALSGSRD